MTLELARPLLKKSSCAACIMRRALVFHLDPAAPVPASAVVDLSSPLITAPLITSQLLITTHHNSSQLITSQLITVPLLTPHLSHHNFSSQLITTYHIPTHHSSTSHTTSHTSRITSELITAPLLTPDITSPHLTPHFSHLPEVHINLRYIKAWHVGLSGPFISSLTSFFLLNEAGIQPAFSALDPHPCKVVPQFDSQTNN